MGWHWRREPGPLKSRWPSQRHHRRGCPRHRTSHTDSLFESQPFLQWYGVQNIAKVRINRESCMALLDNGVQINTIMPSFVKECSLNIGPLLDLVDRWVSCVGLGNALTQPLGYVIIWVQVDGVQGYDKDQIALVIPDLSNFAVSVSVILGTPTISCVVNIIKEKEIDALGKCPSGLSPGSVVGNSHNRRQWTRGVRSQWLRWDCYY